MRPFALLSFSLHLCLCAGPASAQQSSAQDATVHVDRGAALFKEGAFDAALSEFQAAYQATRAWQVLIHIGVTQSRLSRYTEAHGTLQRYLREGGQAVQAAMRARVEHELTRLRKLLAEVTLAIAGGPATVTVDDQDVSEPARQGPLMLDPGKHTFRATREGFDPAEQTVTLVAGERRRIALALKRPKGILRVDSRPKGAQLSINGKVVGRTPWEERLPADTYQIKAELKGHHIGRTRVLLPGNQTRERTIELAAIPVPPKRWYKRWYWWTAIGAGVAGAVVLGVVLAQPSYDVVIRTEKWGTDRQ